MTGMRPDTVVAAAERLLARELTLLRQLTGGQHACAVLVTDDAQRYVVRAFPPGDDAVGWETLVLRRIAPLGGLVPHLVAHGFESGHPVIVTSAIEGGHPGADLAPAIIAEKMARTLARIHRLDGARLRRIPAEPPAGDGHLAIRARDAWRRLDLEEGVLSHGDFWCGNALWRREDLVGAVDWSGARHAPRGFDVAWCRQDLVLLGSPSAAENFVREYEKYAGTIVTDLRAWDLVAAARADPIVETWAVNYHGVGRPELTAEVLRRRFDDWASALEP